MTKGEGFIRGGARRLGRILGEAWLFEGLNCGWIEIEIEIVGGGGHIF